MTQWLLRPGWVVLLLTLFLVGCVEPRYCSVSIERPTFSGNTMTITGGVRPGHFTLLRERPEIDRLVLYNSPGGNIETLRAMAARVAVVEFRGARAASAAAVALTSFPNACIAPSVREVVFHSFINAQTVAGQCQHSVNVGRTENFIASLPPALRPRLQSLTERDTTVSLSLSELQSYISVRLCAE
jgi:hypothetical protein